MKRLNKRNLELTLVSLAAVFYTIRWNYYLYLPFEEIFPTNRFEQFYRIERKTKRF